MRNQPSKLFEQIWFLYVNVIQKFLFATQNLETVHFGLGKIYILYILHSTLALSKTFENLLNY